jgi:hypothetical protein
MKFSEVRREQQSPLALSSAASSNASGALAHNPHT